MSKMFHAGAALRYLRAAPVGLALAAVYGGTPSVRGHELATAESGLKSAYSRVSASAADIFGAVLDVAGSGAAVACETEVTTAVRATSAAEAAALASEEAALSGRSLSSSSSSGSGGGEGDASGGSSEGAGLDEEDEAAAAAAACPGEFSYKEDEHSFAVHPAEGVTLSMQSSVGPAGRDGAAVGLQLGISPHGTNAVYIFSDQRVPSLQAVLQPGMEGKLLKCVLGLRPAPGLSVDVEGVMHAGSSGGGAAAAMGGGDAGPKPGGVQSGKVTAKYAGDDFHTVLQVAPFGDGPPNFELNYHQRLAPGWTAGGSVQGIVSQLLPYPIPVKLYTSAYGSWTSSRQDNAVVWKVGEQPRPDGASMHAGSVQVWHRVTRNLQLGTDLQVTVAADPFTIQDSTAGAGFKMTFENSPGGMSPTLTGHFSSAAVAGISWQKPSASMVSNTFMRTTLSGVFDHKNKAYKVGAQLELYY